jgi:cold shock CspA family protein
VFSNNTSAGLRLTGSSDVHIEGNLIEKNSGPGIGTGGDSPQSTVLSSDIRIANNTIRNNGSTGFPGVMIYSAQDGTITSNLIINNMYDGLQFDDQGSIPGSNWIVQNNICSNTNPMRNQTFGIRVLGLSNNIILQGNECRDNGTSIDHQIVVQNESAVNADWRVVNIISYTPPKTLADFDGDRKTDIGVYHSPSGLWFIKPSSGVADYYVGYGGTGYTPVPGDYDGDEKVDVAVYHQATGLWFIKPSSGVADYYVGYGGTGYAPVPGDYDGDGKTDIAVYHQAVGLWFIKPSSGAADYYVGYGGADYTPLNLAYLHGFLY